MVTDSKSATNGSAKIIYILYLVGIIIGLTSIIGVVMAYVNRSDAPEWLQTHHQFQIRTFWIGLLYLVAGSMLAFVVIGYFILLFWLMWVIVRCVKGLKLLEKQAAVPDPRRWLF